LLRLALYEILYREDIPQSVSINEAVELAKRYSTQESAKFINGILGSFAREKTKGRTSKVADTKKRARPGLVLDALSFIDCRSAPPG
jgi:hypothetical protein